MNSFTSLRANLLRKFPAFASRDFVIFWTGQFISLIGTWMQSVTQPYLAYRITGSRLDLGIIAFANTLPTLLLALPAGVAVERMDKRKTVIVLQAVMMLQAFALAYLALTGRIQLWHIVSLASVLGTANAIEITARQAMLVELVGKPALPNAIALQATIFNTARVLGPALTALVLILVRNQGEGWAFFINGVSFLFVIIGLFFVRTPFRSPPPDRTGQPSRFCDDFRESLRYIQGNSLTAMIILMAALIGFFGFPFIQQAPAIARDLLAQVGDTETIVKARTSGLYLAQGIGAMAAALYIAANSGMKRKGLLLTIGQFTFAVLLVLVAAIRSLPLALTLIMILGWSMVTQLATMNTLIQVQVPDNLRGRVFSAYLWALQGVAPFGSLFVGWVAQTGGIPAAALISGGICLATAFAIHFTHPIIRKHIS
ncbi:MAG: MFS transporter [Chloroflexi bacterium]|nr:MFS transporter [Chloroflexota bacterium]